MSILAIVCLGVDASPASAATTTATSANYDYDYLATFAQRANRNHVRLASPALLSVRLQDAFASVVFVTRSGVAAKSETSLFRAVSSAERADIKSFGGFRQAPGGLSYEGKLFATSAEDAARYGRINYGIDGKPFHIVEARVPRSFAESLYSGAADSMRYVSVGPEQLPQFNALGRINIWNSVPWVAKP